MPMSPRYPGAIACRNVHAAAECDSKVRVVTTNTLGFFEDLPGGHGLARMLVAEGDVAMDEIADRLDARPSRRRAFEEFPGHRGQAVGLAVTAAQEKDQRLGRQVLDRVLSGRRDNYIRQAGIMNDAISRQTHPAGGSDDAAAPIAERVAVDTVYSGKSKSR